MKGRTTENRARTISRVLRILFVALSLTPVIGGCNDAPKPTEVTVMTQNLYFGADLTPVVQAAMGGTPEQFIKAATVAYLQAFATDFPGRMDAVAAGIAENPPALIGLQEVATWSSGPLQDPAPAATVDADFLSLLIASLAARGLNYTVAAVKTGFDMEFPLPTLNIDARLRISDAVLALSGAVNVERSFAVSYKGIVKLDTSVGPIVFPRQLVGVDANVDGKLLTFISTHFESISPLARKGQMAELVGFRNTLPADRAVILVGDFNAEPTDPADSIPSLIGLGGLTDAYAQVGPLPGFTYGHDAFLTDAGSQHTKRIDLVFFGLSQFTSVAADRLDKKTAGGLWASDHTGVRVTLRMK